MWRTKVCRKRSQQYKNFKENKGNLHTRKENFRKLEKCVRQMRRNLLIKGCFMSIESIFRTIHSEKKQSCNEVEFSFSVATYFANHWGRFISWNISTISEKRKENNLIRFLFFWPSNHPPIKDFISFFGQHSRLNLNK